MEIAHRTVDLGEVRLHCAEMGRGPLVLLLHGFPECWVSWRNQLPWLPEAALRAGGFALLRRLFRRDPARPGAYSEEDIEEIVDCARRPDALRGMLAWYRAMMRRPTHTRWQRIDRPVQVIWGEKDRYLGREIAQPSREWVPDLRFTAIPEASHWVQADAPEKVNELLLDFLRA